MNTALLLDEMVGPQVASGLRSRDIDATGIVERVELRSLSDPVELRSLSDLRVLELATKESRMLVTFNVKDFVLLDRAWATTGREHGGIVLVTHRRFPGQAGLVGRLVSALEHLVVTPRSDAPEPGGICFL